MTLLLLACASPAPPAYAPDLSAFSGAEAACLADSCAASSSAEAFAACRKDACAPRPERWKVDPTLVRHEGNVVTMSVQVEHTAGGFGKVDDPTPPKDAWLGATVLTSTGEEIDLAVQTVFGANPDQPFQFSSDVGPDVKDVILGLWGKKIEPCDVARSGCQMFGFVLDDSLAAWPPDTYVEAPPRRQRVLPAQMTLLALGGDATKGAIEAVTKRATERFGTTFTPAEGAGGASAAGPVVLHRDPDDGPLASEFAAAIGGVPVRPDPTAPADIVVVPGS